MTDYDSRMAAQSATIPGTVTNIRVAGYADPGDGGEALYKRVDAATVPQPPLTPHKGYFQSTGGAWWLIAENEPNVRQFGAVGNGVTPDTDFVQDAVDACITLAKPLAVPAGRYMVGPIYLNGRTWKTKLVNWLEDWEDWKAAHPGDDYQDYLDQYYETNPGDYLEKNPNADQQVCLKALIGAGSIWYGSRFVADPDAYTEVPVTPGRAAAVITARNVASTVITGINIDAAGVADVCIDAAWIGSWNGVPGLAAPACFNTFADWLCENAKLKGIIVDGGADSRISNLSYRGGTASVGLSMQLSGGGIWVDNIHLYKGRLEIACQNASIVNSFLAHGVRIVGASYDMINLHACQISNDPEAGGDGGYAIYSKTDAGSFGTLALTATSCFFLGGTTFKAYFAGRWGAGAKLVGCHFLQNEYFDNTKLAPNNPASPPVFDFEHCTFDAPGGGLILPEAVFSPPPAQRLNFVGTYACRRGDSVVLARRDFPAGARFGTGQIDPDKLDAKASGLYGRGQGVAVIPADAYFGFGYNRSGGQAETEAYHRGDLFRITKWDGVTATPGFTFNVSANGAFYPAADNIRNLGLPGQRWATVYAGTGTINPSDARIKTEVAPLTGAEIEAAKALAKEIGTYRFLDAMAAKGDAARLHPGLTVQRAMEIMTAHGLDPLRYGFICHDAWDEEVTEIPAVTDESGKEVAPARTETRSAGDLYSFRPDELMLFIGRGLEARLSALEAAVAGTA
ncbi:tail fiber domain-containing protein [Inquilinus sp. CA228]|uniref:tail fiber domain-containing protein n=1 Tax=Inquilinus sp. CA228 TaxID=3455609 RepID=UPI003F8D7B63